MAADSTARASYASEPPATTSPSFAAAVTSLDYATAVLHRLPLTPEVRELQRRAQAFRIALLGLVVDRRPFLTEAQRSTLLANVFVLEREVEAIARA